MNYSMITQVFGKIIAVNYALPLIPLQWSWLHICLAISCTQNHIKAVVNGQKIVDAQLSKPEGAFCPESLFEKVVLFKGFGSPGVWHQVKGRVANLNIYSSLMRLEDMEKRTAGELCAKQDGDYLSWSNSSWELSGSAKWTEVEEEDLCRKDSRIQLFKTERLADINDCKRLCPKLHEQGKMTPFNQELKDRLINIKNVAPKSPKSIAVWLPIIKENGLWVDIYTRNRVSELEWSQGFPINDSSRNCLMFVAGGQGHLNFPCQDYFSWFCTCHFHNHPFLRLRGLCKDSHMDLTYQPQNNPTNGDLTYYGNIESSAKFKTENNQWEIKTALHKVTALSDEQSGRFMLGKQMWAIEGDNKKCHKGEAYTAILKLTGCKEGEFTCDDGQCVVMENRCNQVSDCRDKSDEKGCKLILFEGDYNMNIPPIGRTDEGVADPANVSISITLMKVVEIEETDHSIHLQFEINMHWRENRVKYQNLKTKTSLNALTKNDIQMLWLPLIVYVNTDQKKTTRLGEYGNGEWSTGVSIIKEGNFSRSGVEEVDEAEIFEGKENTLMMTQTYTHEFQCEYKLQLYPFDTQVIIKSQDPLIPILRNVP